jgi:hypothetical protein
MQLKYLKLNDDKDPRVEVVLLPIADGIQVCRKLG